MRRIAPAVLPAAVLVLAGGCSRGVVHTIPVSRADLPPGEPLIQTLPIDEAYYWVDESGHVGIALRFERGSMWGRAYSAEWLMSLALDKLPAGRERLYQLTVRDLRLLQIRGADRRRGRSFSGIVVLESPRGGRLRGRFHATVRQEVFTLFGGWSAQQRGLVATMAGEFEAVENSAKGREILARTEADGFERPARGRAPATGTAPGS